VLGLGYITVYLCRKNLGVAIPLMRESLSVSKERIGWIASAGTMAYAIGKVLGGPLIDRIGGRAGFLLSLSGVALFAAGGAFAPGLLSIAALYACNRFAGASSWGAMIKLVPSWFTPARTATAIAVLSLSYVAGGAAATMIARSIAAAGGGWRAVMGGPAVFVVLAAILAAFTLRRGPHRDLSLPASHGFSGAALGVLLRRRSFLIACGLSFVVTLLREAFNNWSVDYLTTIQGGTKVVTLAAFQSIGFDIAGVVGILAMGITYERLPRPYRRWLIAGSLFALAFVVAALRYVRSPVEAAVMLAAVGFLVYGPFSLLSGVMALESGGEHLISTAAGIIDGVGYLAGALSGATLGRLLDIGGYPLGFLVLAGGACAAALLALLFEPAPRESKATPVAVL
jgi:sugar phosphate permease